MSNLTDFKKDVLIPRLFYYIDSVFPSMEFQRKGSIWGSPYKLNGEKRHRWDKTYIRSAAPSRIAENGEDTSGVDIVAYYMQQHGIADTKEGFVEAMEQLCKIVGLQLPPMNDLDQYKAYKNKQDRLEKMAAQMEAALYTDEGAETLAYLRERRGYTDDFIKWAHFGYCLPSIENELRNLFEGGTAFPSGFGKDYKVSIPYRSGGDLAGFIFRVTGDTEPKYKRIFTSYNATQKYNLFGLTGLQLTGDREKDREIIVVEGEIDALRATYAGFPNVVAGGSGQMYVEALTKAKQRGVERVTLLLDADGAGLEYTKKAIPTIKKAGLKPFVATLPSDGGKIDVDSFLLKYPSGDELKNIVEEAVSGDMWLFYNRVDEFRKASPENGYNRDGKQIDDFTTDTLTLCNSEYVSGFDRAKILMGYKDLVGIDIQEAADRLKAADLKAKQRQETINLTGEALKLAKDGKTAEALSLIQGKLLGLQSVSDEAEFAKDLIPPTAEDIEQDFKETSLGVATGFAFRGRHGYERFYLPSGALTLICAQTSHGKSKMLENLALQLATDGGEGSVLYFTFEEEVKRVRMQLLNTFANVELTGWGNNLRTIEEILTKGNSKYARTNSLPAFLEAKSRFISLLESGQLLLFSKYSDGAMLSRAIRYYHRHSKVKAVFVDYIQLMRMRNPKAGHKEELRDICDMLKDLSKDTGLPIVLAAQLNRQTPSPIDMSCQNISDATDIEQSANVVMLLWNSATKPKAEKGNTYYTDRAKGRLSDEAEKLKERGFVAGEAGKIYAVLDKNRGGERYMDAVFTFNGNTGKIEPNYTDALPLTENISELRDEDEPSPF